MAHSKRASQKTTLKGKPKGPAALRNQRLRATLSAQKTPPPVEDTPPGVQEQAEPIAVPTTPLEKPEILAPAGDMPAALAALAAGADALYLGLKHFSARMQAENFSVKDLAKLASLAHKHERKIYVTVNSLVKPNDIHACYRLMRRLATEAHPDALIIQDPGIIPLAREAGFMGELHLSTLANITHPKALEAAKNAGAQRIILPRELSFDEIAMTAASRPEGLDLELFVHGALCYCVSGRCWWSSYMGGKSGLRGRCVQPCRRVYNQKKYSGRFFSCLDLSVSSSVRQLLDVPGIRSWKIEGRKKSPHYVYNVVQGYRLLCDAPETTPNLLKEADKLFNMALGRQRSQAFFMSTKDTSPNLSKEARHSHTGSGLLVGFTSRVDAEQENAANHHNKRPSFTISPTIPLIAKDLLRIGHEDEQWHCTLPIHRPVDEGTILTLPLPISKQPRNGTPVYLIDRKEPAVQQAISAWEKELTRQRVPSSLDKEDITGSTAPEILTTAVSARPRKLSILVRSSLPQGKEAKQDIRPGTVSGLWISNKAVKDISKTLFDRISWWLPPVVWPNEEEALIRTLRSAVRKGARHFVCNSPWQTALFDYPEKLTLTAGPFCNLANPAAFYLMRELGFKSAIISPELSGEEILSLPGQSALPLGIVTSGWWPMGISRFSTAGVKPQQVFTSPMGEEFWYRQYGQNAWIYPGWPLDITDKQQLLEQAGYTTFITLQEYPPHSLKEPKRTSPFNWDLGLL